MKKVLCSVLTTIALSAFAAAPAFHIPFDGNALSFGPDGKKNAGNTKGKLEYVDGIKGKALNISRSAKDGSYPAVQFFKLAPADFNEGTVAFWFKPLWNDKDGKNHTFFYCDSWTGFRFYLVKVQDGGLDLSVCAPDQIQIFARIHFDQNEWQHFAFTWNIAKGELKLFVNGIEKGKRVVAKGAKAMTKKHALNLFFGGNVSNKDKANLPDGYMDDFRIYTSVLSVNDIAALARKNEAKTNK